MKFLNKKEHLKIRDAIVAAENQTSGEIKIHIENHCSGDVNDRAKEVFYLLHLDKTNLKNAVLLYIAIVDKKVAIIGDEGIHQFVSEDYWNIEINQLILSFKNNDFSEGIIQTITNVGQNLKTYFPYQSNDLDEISDSISFYEN